MLKDSKESKGTAMKIKGCREASLCVGGLVPECCAYFSNASLTLFFTLGDTFLALQLTVCFLALRTYTNFLKSKHIMDFYFSVLSQCIPLIENCDFSILLLDSLYTDLKSLSNPIPVLEADVELGTV